MGKLWRRWFRGRPASSAFAASDTLVARVNALEDHQEQRMLRVAEEALRRGHPDQAVIAYQKAAARFRSMGQRLKQVAVLQHLVRLQPDRADPLRALIDVYDDLERLQEAASTRLRLAAVLRRSGAVDEADRVERAARRQAFSAPHDDIDAEDPSFDVSSATPEMPGEPVQPGQIEPSLPPSLPVPYDLSDPADSDIAPTLQLPEPPPAPKPRPFEAPPKGSPASGLSLKDLAPFETTNDVLPEATASMTPVAFSQDSTDLFEPSLKMSAPDAGEMDFLEPAPAHDDTIMVDDQDLDEFEDSPAFDPTLAMPAVDKRELDDDEWDSFAASRDEDPVEPEPEPGPAEGRGYDEDELPAVGPVRYQGIDNEKTLAMPPSALPSSLAIDGEDTDAGPAPVSPVRIANDATMLNEPPLPEAVAHAASKRNHIPNDETRAYRPDEVDQLQDWLKD